MRISLKTKKVMLVVLLSLVLAIVGVVGITKAVSANDSVPALKAEYSVGEELKIPSKTLSLGDSSAAAYSVVRYPSGKAIKTSSLTLDEAGVYTVEYRATVGGELVTEEETFLVNRNFYSFSGGNSSATYGVDDSQYQTGRKGLNFKIASGETLTFEKTFNIHDIDGEFIKFYVTPATKGVVDVQGFYIYVTDVYDSSNYIKIKLQSVTFGGNTYVYLASYTLAAYNEEVLSAQDSLSNNMIRRNDRFGACVWLSLYGNAGDYENGQDMKDQWASYTYDSETMELFVSSNKGKNLIVDFNDPKFFDDSWKGFTTGDVRVSIEGYGYTGKYFNFNLMSLADEDISATVAKDDVKPEITVDYNGYTKETVPNGVVGQTYKVFDAYARDSFDGIIDVDVRAYYAYNSDSQSDVNIENGKIKTVLPGKYAIVYTATDVCGNSSQVVVPFSVTSDAADLKIALVDGNSESCKVGETVKLKTYSVSGNVGKAEVSVSFGDKEVRYTEGASSFIPMETGAYTVRYTVTDYSGRVNTVSYTVNVAANEKPVVLDSVILPSYVIANKNYYFPEVSAYDFNQNKYVSATLYVDGAACSDGAYKAAAEKDGQDVSVQYKVGNAVVLEASVRVVTVNTKYGSRNAIDFAKYWQSTDLTVTTSTANTTFANHGDSDSFVSGDLTAEYIKPVMLSSFSMTLGINPEESNFEELVITFTDVYDSANKLSIGMFNDDFNYLTYFTINGKKTVYTFTAGGFYDDFDTVKLVYSDGKISDGANISQKISDIFDASKVYVSVTVKGADGAASFAMAEFCGQNIMFSGTTLVDYSNPVMSVNGEIESRKLYGEKFIVRSVEVEDVLDTDVKVTVTVIAPNGNKVLDKASALIEHEITFNQYGRYSIVYTATDSSSRSTTYTYVSTCVNTEKPVITVNGSVSNGKVGKKLTLPAATVTDDVDTGLEVLYFVVEPSGNIILLGEDRTYTPKIAGNYRARYYSYDSSGNVTIVDRYFTVEG